MKTDAPIIHTPRLALVRCDLALLDVMTGTNDSIAAYLDVTVPEVWTEFGEPAFQWTRSALEKPGVDARWWMYLPVLKSENTLVGTCGFKGEPAEGMVEIGYEVARDYRGRGLASEIATALIRYAFETGDVLKVQAHTLGQTNESGTVLSKAGMQKCEEVSDPEDGLLWRWEVIKGDKED